MKANKVLIVILLNLLAVSCNQDAILFTISTETAPRKPRIEGAPTNIVVFEREVSPGNTIPIMYVASGRLHWYAKAPDGTPQWDLADYKIPQPEGKIISLAVTDKRLYALCREGTGVNARLRYLESQYAENQKWEEIDYKADIQTIYVASESQRLFVGVGRNTYNILYLDTAENNLKMLKENSSLLSGAVYRNGINYLSTSGNGIYQIAENDLAQNRTVINQLNDRTDVENDRKNERVFMSLIKMKDNTIIAIERNGGALFKVQDGSFARIRYTIDNNNNWITTGKYTTRAVSLWEDYLDANRKLLVIGIQGGLYSTTTSSYTHGYIEFELSDNSLNTNAVRHDPGKLQTVADQNRYTTSLGKQPINHLFQAPREIDENMTFFASTQTAGLWSYRDRRNNGGWQWNAEGEDEPPRD